MSSAHPSAAEHRGEPRDTSRRDFLLASAGVLGASALLASAAKGVTTRLADENFIPPPPAADAKALRIGVIGTGGPGGCAMGLGHCLSFVELAKPQKDRPALEKVEVVAICDLNQLHLDYAKKEIEKAQPGVKLDTYTNYKELIARKDLDGILAAVPEHWHAQMGIEILKAGRDLYLEKPMTLNLADALALHQAAQSHSNVIAQVGTQYTRLPKYHAARKLIKDGAIGTPTFSQTSYCRNSKEGEWHYTINPEWKPGVNLDWETWCGPLGKMAWDPKVYYQWRRYRKTSTGIVGDLLVHVMTPMVMALDQGWPVRVVATGGHLVDKDMENHDNINIAVQFETGHQMFIAGSTCNESGVETMIRGHKGNIYLGDRHCTLRPERIFSEEVDEQKVECPDIGNDQDVHRLGWLHSIRTREQPLSSVELGLKIMVIVDLATRSMWEGSAFTFDPATMKSAKA